MTLKRAHFTSLLSSCYICIRSNLNRELPPCIACFNNDTRYHDFGCFVCLDCHGCGNTITQSYTHNNRIGKTCQAWDRYDDDPSDSVSDNLLKFTGLLELASGMLQ